MAGGSGRSPGDRPAGEEALPGLPWVRPMVRDDVEDVAAFVNDCWRQTYRGILADDFLDGLTTEDRMARIRGDQDGGARAWLVRDRDGLAGMVMAGPSHQEFFESDGEVTMIYVRDRWLGTGLGHELFAGACRWLVDAGFEAIVLDVFLGNERAARFYRRHGLRTVRVTGIQLGGRRYPLEVMRRPLP